MTDAAFGGKVARFYESMDRGDDSVRCELCPNRCVIGDGRAGLCRVRKNRGGTLYADSWGIVASLALDPIEKKPLVGFHPGSFILSVGGYGCNLSCKFCQNHQISQVDPPDKIGEDQLYSPERLRDEAVSLVSSGNIGLAFTYNEPFISWEYVRDCAVLIREAGLKNVLVTNGYVNPEPLEEILPLIDAMNIDLKSFSGSFYRTVCGGTLEPVLATIAASIPRCHVEITTLVIPGLNSTPAEIGSLAAWLASIDPSVILHLNRHHPDYRMMSPEPIPRDELFALADVARRYLQNVHCGNV